MMSSVSVERPVRFRAQRRVVESRSCSARRYQRDGGDARVGRSLYIAKGVEHAATPSAATSMSTSSPPCVLRTRRVTSNPRVCFHVKLTAILVVESILCGRESPVGAISAAVHGPGKSKIAVDGWL